MKHVVNSVAIVMGLLLVTSSALAQFGGLGDFLKPKGAGVDAGKVEAMLKEVVVTSSISIGHLLTALGHKEEADKMAKSAECLQKNECGVKDAVEVLTGNSQSMQKDVAEKMARGEKLDADASQAAMKAILPGLKVLPLWTVVVKDSAAVAKEVQKNPSSAMNAVGLVRALPVVPGAMQGTVTLFKTSIDYLSFSGADTTEVQAVLVKGMEGM